MNDEISQLKEKIKDLEQELSSKSLELQVYRNQLKQANSQIEKMIAQLSHELKMAGQIQKLLSPTELPNISGFEISSKFISGTRSGGDYFDIFEHEDKMKFGVLVASASGYSLSALFLSILIKLASQVEAKKGLPPNEFLKKLAAEMTPQMGPKDKTSVFYGVLDRRTYELEYCGMGPIDVYVQSHGQESLTHFEMGVEPLSTQSTPPSESLKFAINAKDRLIICTEGIAKSYNDENQTWGGDGLRNAIRGAPKTGVHELRNEILFQNQKFSGLTEPVRDQTVLVIEAKDHVIKLVGKST